jgi:hypothetical protein
VVEVEQKGEALKLSVDLEMKRVIALDLCLSFEGQSTAISLDHKNTPPPQCSQESQVRGPRIDNTVQV